MHSAWSNVALPSSSLVLYISAQSVRVLGEFTLSNGVLHALDALVNGVLCAGRIDVINMYGCEQVAARLELLVVGRGSETEASCGPSGL
eukprot:5987681-Pyramimonas_sp.AAC.1